jgi:hypothetical protein
MYVATLIFPRTVPATTTASSEVISPSMMMSCPITVATAELLPETRKSKVPSRA